MKHVVSLVFHAMLLVLFLLSCLLSCLSPPLFEHLFLSWSCAVCLISYVQHGTPWDCQKLYQELRQSRRVRKVETRSKTEDGRMNTKEQ